MRDPHPSRQAAPTTASHIAGRAAVQAPGAIDRLIGMFSSPAVVEEPPQGHDEQLLADIGQFLSSHRLGVTPATLRAAHDFVVGSDLTLVRKVREREDAGQRITQPWIEGLTAQGRRTNERQQNEELLHDLEQQAVALEHAAKSASTATSDYGDTLEQGGNRIGEGKGSDLDSLVDLVQGMVRHTRTLHGKLIETEERAGTMRRDLDKARRQAAQDHLTGLPNRRAFATRLELAIRENDGPADDGDTAHAKHNAPPICVGFCDIDHFKQFNDTYGHDTGDRVLREVAQHLSRTTGADCYVARHGGEEFALLFEGLALDDAHRHLDQSRASMGERRLKDRRTGKELGMITFSAGLTQREPGVPASDVLRLADEALYAAKQQGRNRIVARQP
ncbi:putative signaling protein [Alteripontixanthobacter maritimus]|uniref:diguanylate cyclase n=1 Tax=Alteripontixanthobacter maritimus TaxID=2161824 RepID=A0A369Q7E8_9SPHN|nr:GGDEF domain-containing protein [Alteripontixanthobacter maritimus]RDC60392.1 putative signaling protein [Alteripontixanthobacter maritimus]